MIYYLPSCKVKTRHKEASLKIQEYLNNNGVEVLGCCKLSQEIFKKGDTVITNCTSCAIITDECSPNVKEISLYEYLLEENSFKWPNYNGENITVQDCLRTIHKPQLQLAVRSCLEKMNIKPIEIKDNFDKSRFDGLFCYRKMSDVNKKFAPVYFSEYEKEYVKKVEKDIGEEYMKEWCKQYTTDRIVVYCNSCLEGIKIGGANGVHLVELIANVTELQEYDCKKPR